MKRIAIYSILPVMMMTGMISCAAAQPAPAQQEAPPYTTPPPQYGQPAQSQYNPQPPSQYGGQQYGGAQSGAPVANSQSSRWPMQAYTADGAQVTIFQPQLEDFQGDQLKARAAVAVTAAGQQTQVFGAIWLQSRVVTDRVNRTVRIVDVNVTSDKFPGADPVSEPSLAAAVKQVLMSNPATLSLDQLLTMVGTIQKANNDANDIQNTPPRIIFMDRPAMKVQYDGPPRLAQAQGTNILQAVNTPFFVALSPDTKRYYLKGAGRWFEASDPMGPFQLTGSVPNAVSQLAATNGYVDPQQPIPDDQAAALQIVAATEPTELIWTEGEPQMGIIPGTSLLYFTNTDSDVFMSIDTQQLYVLLAGRWYIGANRNGPWTYVDANNLPADFKRIPSTSDKGDVLAHIPGTMAAQDAVADTAIPQTAAINRQQFEQPPVEYDGDANFQPIGGTNLSYAVNTPQSVVLVNGQYYCCYNGAWYQCGAPTGPWQICVQVPQEIYAIPPSCPIYAVRYCHVYGYTPDVCYVGYTPGYTGSIVYGGVVVYGTGHRYEPWEGRRFYVARPETFGFAPHYNTYTGNWGFGFALKFGGATWVGREDNRHERSEQWFGHGGYRPTYGHSDPQVRDSFVRNEIAARPARVATPDQPRRDLYSRNVYERRSDLRTDIIRPDARGGRGQGPDQSRNIPPARNDVFSDPQGNTYRRTPDGWQTRDNSRNQWQAAPGNESPQNQPNQGGARVEPGRGDAGRSGGARGDNNARADNNARGENNARGGNNAGPAARGETPRSEQPQQQEQQPQQIVPRAGTGTVPRVVQPPAETPAPAPASPARGEQPRQRAESPRGGATEKPAAEPSKPAAEPNKPAAAPQEPAKAEPAHPAPPPPSGSNPDLNKDYHARVAGEQRDKAYHQPAPPPPPPAAPAPAPAPAPAQPAPAPHPAAPASPPPAAAPAPAPTAPAQPAPGARGRSGTRQP